MLTISERAPLTLRDALLGDDAHFCGWRARELTRVDREGMTYLDYTGAALYAESLVRADALRLGGAVLGNPHSEHGPSRVATQDVERARSAILAFLHADPAEYAVVLTTNATAACRLVAESFPFRAGSVLALAADNHNSVNGIREYARARGAGLAMLPLDDELRLADPMVVLDEPGAAPSLFALPAQSNFSGARHPLSLIAEARTNGWRVLLDAASYVPTAELRLNEVRPDFVALSMYKIAGYPSGVGALVARHAALAELRRPSFAGGTVQWVSVQRERHQLAGGASGFEDGTVPFLAVGAVPAALAAVEDAGRERLARHLRTLTADLLFGLQSLQHRNGAPVIRIHGPRTMEARGATIAMSVLAADGTALPYWEVEEAAREARLAVRGGCFCNPGCSERAFGIASDLAAACLDELGEDFTIPKFADCLGGVAVGAVRMSLGLGSVREDVRRALAFIESLAA